MSKRKSKTESETIESYEKLRDELFEYRVDIKSYKRSMNTLIATVPVVMTILGFFGYNRVEGLLENMEARANARLAKTDSLLAMVDTRYLDSLKEVVNERTLLYEEAIAALERGTRVNNEIYKKLIESLPYNKRLEAQYDMYYSKDAFNLFDIVYYSEEYGFNKTGECYIVMGDEYVKEPDDVFLVEVLPRERNVALYYQLFEVHDNYNRLFYKFNKFEKYNEYVLRVVLLRKHGKDRYGYLINKGIIIK